MTNHSLLRVMATALALAAACKSEFPAGSYDDGGPQDVAAQEAANSQEGGPPTSSSLVSCDPFQPTTKPIALTTVLGAGRDTDGTLYVVDQPQPGGERVFVSSGGTLQRQRIAGSGTENSGNGVTSYSFSVSDHVPPFMLELETNAAGPTAMGVLQGTTDLKTFTIGQQGSVLTLVPASQVATLPVANIPAQTFIEYNANLSDGRALLVVRPLDDWTYQDFRVFFGAVDRMIERTVGQVTRLRDGGSTTINFSIDGVAAVASFSVSLTGVAPPPTLTIGTTQFTLTLGPTASPPAGYSYSCFGNSSLDGGAVDGPSSADGASTGAQESGPPTSSSSGSCDPFQPTTKPISLTTVLGAGRDTDGTLYVVDQPQPGSERVFVSSGGTLQRQRIAGSGTENSGNGVMSYSFSISDHIPPFVLKLEANAAGPTAMGVLQGTTDVRTFTIGQQGSVLTLVPASQVATLPVANIPAQTFIEYNANLSDGRALLVVRPLDDWTYQDFRVFFGATDRMIEQPVGQVTRLQDGGSTTINFTIDGVAAVASFPVSLTGVAAPPTLTIGTTQFTLTLGPTSSPPAGYSYSCLGNPSHDGGVDSQATPADGPATCRAPSPDYGPTSTFSVLPDGTPAATANCSAACGDSAWLGGGPSSPNIDIALPYGSCAPDTPACSTTARIPCACASPSAPLDAFNCGCEGGTWICRIRVAGTAACLPCRGAGSPDAGNDASPALQGIFVATGSMSVARDVHTATLLPSGRVLIAGGSSGSSGSVATASAELYDPVAGTFTRTGSMTSPRQFATATVLRNGNVLIAGGDNSIASLASAELYDPQTGKFLATGSMTVAREYATATLLSGGKVLIAGGYSSSSFTNFATAELYDPEAGTFTPTGSMTVARLWATATLLPSGKVLIAGGNDGFGRFLTSAELYDPGAETFVATGDMAVARVYHTATLLQSNKVLIVGGGDDGTSAELYDPGAGTFATTGRPTDARSGHTATLLPSGLVLITGGDGIDNVFSSAELFDPSAGKFTATNNMTAGRGSHVATLLSNGTVLITGGITTRYPSLVLASAELYE